MILNNTYQPRFVSDKQLCELVNLFHLARTALATKDHSRHKRMIWAAEQFNKLNPVISVTAAYKDLSSSLDQ